MHFEERSHYSGHLGREMYFNRYGHGGLPIIVFPSSGGSKEEYASFKMIETLRSFIDAGKVHFYTVESIDGESWNAEGKWPYDKGLAHNQYDKYIIHEMVPLIRHESQWGGKLGVTGCSMGGFHAVNFALRHPDVIGLTIAQSGVYDARFFTGEYNGDMPVYENSPVDYLSNMSDDWFLNQYRQNHFLISVGRGDWEGPHVADTQRLEQIFNQKNIPAWFDYWGEDVPHDWPAWRDQIYHFFNVITSQGVI